MELINTSCADAMVEVSASTEDDRLKFAVLLAKVTCEVQADGGLRAVVDDPCPLSRTDVQTPLGLLPRDTSLPAYDGVAVLINGAACAAKARPVEQMQVSAAVGETRVTALVFGNRRWVETGGAKAIGRAEPFVRMPMTYAQAYGGTAEVWIDERSVIAVRHPQNPHGKGFDAAVATGAIATHIDCPPGYPRHDAERLLPNVELPGRSIRAWPDEGVAFSWSARPADVIGYDIARWTLDVPPAHVRARCHPELLLAAVPRGTPVVLEGMDPNGTVGFTLTPPDVVVDYEIDGRSGERPLGLRRVTILPDERRVLLLYEYRFRYRADPAGLRSLRLRVAG